MINLMNLPFVLKKKTFVNFINKLKNKPRFMAPFSHSTLSTGGCAETEKWLLLSWEDVSCGFELLRTSEATSCFLQGRVPLVVFHRDFPLHVSTFSLFSSVRTVSKPLCF